MRRSRNRRLKKGGRGFQPVIAVKKKTGWKPMNINRRVDAKHTLLVAQEVTKAVTAVDQLSSIAVQPKEALQVEQLKVKGL
jgi:hypothetical protein